MISWRYICVGLAMVGASGLALALRPVPAVEVGTVDLERQIPSQFGTWREVKTGLVQMDLTPRQDGQQSFDPLPLYDQTLMRTYQAADGRVVMLALAWGRVQRQEMKIHRPELCYAAQGFMVDDRQAVTLDLGQGIKPPAYHMLTRNSRRVEPVTYWIRIGGSISMNAWQTRRRILGEGLRGTLPDGILVRVSQALPIGSDSRASYAAQERFLGDLLAAIDPRTRTVLIGR